jgi:hypothetical protein
MLVPYISSWSEEVSLPAAVIQRGGRIAYADEALGERDSRGVLWRRVLSRPGRGEPQFGQVHTPRQRHAQRKLLCQVCGGPADRNEAGTLWLVTDYHNDWSNWPERMACSEPPICLRCARISIRVCPGLQRHGHAAFRVAHSELAGVYGILYRPGPFRPIATTDERIPFTDPDIRWTQASQLLRELHHCTEVDLDQEDLARCP